jgi:hypothetical protein
VPRRFLQPPYRTGPRLSEIRYRADDRSGRIADALGLRLPPIKASPQATSRSMRQPSLLTPAYLSYGLVSEGRDATLYRVLWGP